MKLVWGVFRLAAIAAATVCLAGCMTAAVGPDHPGTRVRYKSPDPQKWMGNQVFGDRRAIFRCSAGLPGNVRCQRSDRGQSDA
jgi:hypothetical protein